LSEISGFRRGVPEVLILLGRYAPSMVNLLPMFRNSVSVLFFKGEAVQEESFT